MRPRPAPDPRGSGSATRRFDHADHGDPPDQVTGTVGEAEALAPMTLTVCGTVPFTSGNHLLEAPVTDAFKVTSLMAQPVAPTATPPQRPAKIVGSWTAQHRTVKVGAGASSYLVVAQNFNIGWKATLDGRTLTPVRVDGWQQAWIVPAGTGGKVQMDFAQVSPLSPGTAPRSPLPRMPGALGPRQGQAAYATAGSRGPAMAGTRRGHLRFRGTGAPRRTTGPRAPASAVRGADVGT